MIASACTALGGDVDGGGRRGGDGKDARKVRDSSSGRSL